MAVGGWFCRVLAFRGVIEKEDLIPVDDYMMCVPGSKSSFAGCCH